MKRLLCVWLSIALSVLSIALPAMAAPAGNAVAAAPLEDGAPFPLETPSYLLMEASTGAVIFEKDADMRRPVASVTKLMTILLTLEALSEGTISLQDMVMVSKAAAGMGGSQALLDAGSTYKLEELLKSTIVASANDASVALAEHIGGTEQNFVDRMNARARELGLENTSYRNVTGLPAEGQYTTARDVATLSRALSGHSQYYKYSTIWMDTITHKGGRVTELTNTNRLVRFYEACDGFKTGSTNEAKYCISATAKKDGMRMIAVVLGTRASQTRFDEARKMLEHGFATYRLFDVCQEGDTLEMEVAVERGGMDAVRVAAGEGLTLLLRRGTEGDISLEVALPEKVEAPIQRGDALGEIRVMQHGKATHVLPAVAATDVRLPGYLEALLRILSGWR